MAMHDPGPGIVSREGDEQVAAAGESRRVATGWVVEGEAGGAAVPHSGTLSYNVEVVALGSISLYHDSIMDRETYVEMDWVRQRNSSGILNPP